MNPNDIAKSIASGEWRPNLHLTNVSIAHFQDQSDFIAGKVFPVVLGRLPMNKYYKFKKEDLARSNVHLKPAFGSVQPAVFSQEEDSYSTEVYQEIIGIDQISSLAYKRTNAPGVADPRVAKAKVLAEQLKIFMDQMFANHYFKPGAWSNELTGSASTPTATTFYQFDNANSDPVKLIDEQKIQMRKEGLRKPNKLVIGVEAYIALKQNPTILDRVNYGGSTANPATVTENVLAQLFEVEQVFVVESAHNKAPQGAPDADMEYICDPKGMLLCYTTNSPAIDEPSAGYTFTWDMLGNGQWMAVTNYLGAPATHSEFVEGICAFDMKQVCPDLAVYFKDCVS